MGQEIERKFLVKSGYDYLKMGENICIVQGYLNSNKERTVRVRIAGSKGYLTIKGEANQTGITRFELEKEISVHEAKELLKMCEPGLIEKTRVKIPLGTHTFEVDIFAGDNAGLIVAEVELTKENEHFDKPEWLDKEVTLDKRYSNSMLTKNPFIGWATVK